eukprot:TRINITY_DN37442_c0_g1_i1.p1 TRINITY_DN37442_c0_g1~~TRINITY_DN37442_c0_g1_i1.p1  ORF type:complete len:1545 (-),score=209.55 TRINITY_DN37442_c0_g1_i1:117-4751(-)
MSNVSAFRAMKGRRCAHGSRTSTCFLKLMVLVCNLAFAQPPGQSLNIRIHGSCDMKLCASVMNGLKLLKLRINKGGLIKAFDNVPVSIAMDIKDDDGKGEETLRIYRRHFLRKYPFSGFIGPFPSDNAKSVLNLARQYKKVIVLHNAGEGRLYTTGYDQVFSTSLLIDNVTKPVLENLHELGARSIAIFDDSTNSANAAICADGLSGARSLGWNVVGNGIVDSADSLLNLRKLLGKNIDVFLVCSSFTKSREMMLFMASVQDINPKAMIMPDVWSNAVAKRLYPSLLVDTFTLVSWDLQSKVEADCPIWGSRTEFVEMYTREYKTQPTVEVVEAVVAAQAAILGIAKAVQRQQPSLQPGRPGRQVDPVITLNQTDIVRVMRHLETGSLLGKLSFNTDGTMIDRKLLTKQLALPQTANRFVRYFSGLQLVETNITYPARTWADKEIDTFPCEDGEELNRSYLMAVLDGIDIIQSKLCLPCPSGWSRDRSRTDCGRCPKGRFATGVGNVHCYPCPKGANCSEGAAFENGSPYARRDYYHILGSNPPTYVACLRGLCLGSNVCVDNNIGPKCTSCKPSFTNTLRARGEHRDMICIQCPETFQIFATIVSVFLFYLLLVVFVASLIESSVTVLPNITPIIIRIALDHLHTYGAVAEANDMPESHFAVGVYTLFLNPVSLAVTHDCMADVRYGRGSTRAIMGLLLIPCVLVVHIILFVLQVVFIKIWDRSGKMSDADHEFSRARSRIRCMTKRTLRQSTIWVFLLYPCTLMLLLEGCRCVNLGESNSTPFLRAASNLDVECGKGGHGKLRIMSLVGLLLYGLAIPTALMLVLRRYRNLLSSRAGRLIFGFLCSGFQERFFYAEVLILLRKFLILAAVAIPDKITVCFLTLCVCFASFIIHELFLPFDSHDRWVMNTLESLGSLAVMCKAIAGLIYNLQHDETDAIVVEVYARWLEPLLQISFFCYIARCFLRGMVTKNLALKHCFMPTRMRWWEGLIVNCGEPNRRTVVWDWQSHRLFISALSSNDRRFLWRMLADVLLIHLNVAHHFTSGRLVTALREAMAMCIAERRARAINVLVNLNDFRESRQSLFEQETTCDSLEDEKKTIGVMGYVMVMVERLLGKNMSSKTKLNASSSNSAPVEELQHALMLCKDDIATLRPSSFIVEHHLEVPLMEKHMRISQSSPSILEEYLDQAAMYKESSSSGDDVAYDPTQERAQEVAMVSAMVPHDVALEALARDCRSLQDTHFSLVSECRALHANLLDARALDPEKATHMVAASQTDMGEGPCNGTALAMATSSDAGQSSNFASFQPEVAFSSSVDSAVAAAVRDFDIDRLETSAEAGDETDPRGEGVSGNAETMANAILTERRCQEEVKDVLTAPQQPNTLPGNHHMLPSSKSREGAHIDEWLAPQSRVEDSTTNSEFRAQPARREVFMQGQSGLSVEESDVALVTQKAIPAHPLASALRNVVLFGSLQSSSAVDASHPLINAVIVGDAAEVHSLICARANVAQQDIHGKEARDYANDNIIILAMIDSADPNARTRSLARKRAH